jgi:Transcription factor DP/E2F/DP family winged-helix DNA-binding domain
MEESDQRWNQSTKYNGSFLVPKQRSSRGFERSRSSSGRPKKAISPASRKHAVGASREHAGKRSVSGKYSTRLRHSSKASMKLVSFRKHHITATEDDDMVTEITSHGSPAATSTRGLRQMSIIICEKVKASGTTTCSEVADELLQKIKREQAERNEDKTCDDKNIRRRLYDALNVLEAVNVIEKENKDITWKGMPEDDLAEYNRLAAEHEKRMKVIRQKDDELRERLVQHVAYQNLVRYNMRRAPIVRAAKKISLPFVIMNAHPDAEVHCDATRDLSHMMMEVNAPFALHDDKSILRHMGL